jgi:signal transduction histidine kinase
LIGRRKRRGEQTVGQRAGTAAEAARGRFLLEESRELLLLIDEQQRLVGASRRARELLPSLALGEVVAPELLDGGEHWTPLVVPYELGGRREELVYLADTGDQSAYEDLRAGFTAAVSHELRTPLARLLVLLESAGLPGSDTAALIKQARGEIEQMRELIDDVLFLSELETGREVVALGTTRALPVLEEVAAELAERADRGGIRIEVEGEAEIEFPLRARMLRMVALNLGENALRYAGEGATLRLSVGAENGRSVLTAADDGAGVEENELPRLFERFYRADRARASRGTGLGLAIVKHIVTSAGGTVEVRGGLGRGLQIRCVFAERS